MDVASFHFELRPTKDCTFELFGDIDRCFLGCCEGIGLLSVCGFRIPVCKKCLASGEGRFNEWYLACWTFGVPAVNVVCLEEDLEGWSCWQWDFPVISFDDVRYVGDVLSYRVSFEQLDAGTGRRLPEEERYEVEYLFICNLKTRLFSVLDLITMQFVAVGEKEVQYSG